MKTKATIILAGVDISELEQKEVSFFPEEFINTFFAGKKQKRKKRLKYFGGIMFVLTILIGIFAYYTHNPYLFFNIIPLALFLPLILPNSKQRDEEKVENELYNEMLLFFPRYRADLFEGIIKKIFPSKTVCELPHVIGGAPPAVVSINCPLRFLMFLKGKLNELFYSYYWELRVHYKLAENIFITNISLDEETNECCIDIEGDDLYRALLPLVNVDKGYSVIYQSTWWLSL